MPAYNTKMSNIDKWLIFSILEPDFISNIKIVCVFGSSGNEALIVNKDDDVYALGSNCSGCLGLGDSHGSLEPRKGRALVLNSGVYLNLKQIKFFFKKK